MDRIRVGNVDVVTLLDCTPPARRPTDFFPDVPASAWEPYRTDYLNSDGTVHLDYCCFLLRSSGRIILVDTGLGPGPHAVIGGVRGQLLAQLHAQGVRAEDVDTVVITHLHPDHIGWNVSQQEGRPVPTFPRARYLLPRGDWDYFTSPERVESVPHVKANALPLKGLKVLTLVDGDHAVTPEITTLATPGHTPGHVSVLVSSAGERAIVVGDVFHVAVQVTEADWCPRIDFDREVSQKTRHALLDRAEKESLTLVSGHLPKGRNIGKVVRLQGRRYWQAL